MGQLGVESAIEACVSSDVGLGWKGSYRRMGDLDVMRKPGIEKIADRDVRRQAE